MKGDIAGIIAGAMAVIGFISVWVKMGIEKGENKKRLETLEKKAEKHEDSIAELKKETHGIQIEIARDIGKIEVKLDHIKEAVDALKGGRRAKEK